MLVTVAIQMDYRASDSSSSSVVGFIPQQASLLAELDDEPTVSLGFRSMNGRIGDR
jgi:hypothetical protein